MEVMLDFEWLIVLGLLSFEIVCQSIVTLIPERENEKDNTKNEGKNANMRKKKRKKTTKKTLKTCSTLFGVHI